MPSLNAHRAEITSLAARYRLPAVYPYRFFTELGGLLSYGNDLLDNFRRAATYADRILKGAKPSELPVQAPVKFELVINLKTAKALGLDVPPQLSAARRRGDRVRIALLLHCMSPVMAHSVALNPFCQGLLIGAKRTPMLRRGNAGF